MKAPSVCMDLEPQIYMMKCVLFIFYAVLDLERVAGLHKILTFDVISAKLLAEQFSSASGFLMPQTALRIFFDAIFGLKIGTFPDLIFGVI